MKFSNGFQKTAGIGAMIGGAAGQVSRGAKATGQAILKHVQGERMAGAQAFRSAQGKGMIGEKSFGSAIGKKEKELGRKLTSS